MENVFFTKDDLMNATQYVPAEKIDTLVTELNRIVRLRTTGKDEGAWTNFLSQYGLPVVPNAVIARKRKPATRHQHRRASR